MAFLFTCMSLGMHIIFMRFFLCIGACVRLNESTKNVTESVGSLQVCVELVDVLDGLQRKVVVEFNITDNTTGA